MTRLEKLKKRFEEVRARMLEIKALSAESITDDVTEEAERLVEESGKLRSDIRREEEFERETREAQQFAYTTIEDASATDAANEGTTEERSSGIEVKRKPIFRNFGENLYAIYRCSDPSFVRTPEGQVLLEKLHKVGEEARAATGLSSKIDSDVGFVIQTDFAGAILESVINDDPFLSLVDTYDIGPESDSVKFVQLDESDVSTTVFGGVQVYWAGEGNTVTATKPKLQERKFELEKLMGFAYATGESLRNTTFISQLYERAFTTAIQRKLLGDIIAGNGVGRPLGIINASCTVTQAIESGQTTATPILYKNIVKMWNRLLPDSRRNAVWVIHPDVEAPIMFVDFPVGTGGVPVFLPPGGGINNGVSTLFGRPVMVSDHCSALNNEGDIILCDPTQYMVIRKGDIQSATSIHVRFLYDEECFRWIFPANGMPKPSSAITLKNSSLTRGSFVTLGARSA